MQNRNRIRIFVLLGALGLTILGFALNEDRGVVEIPAGASIAADDTQFLVTGGGQRFTSLDLVGSTLNLSVEGKPLQVTIKRVFLERDHISGSEVMLHHLVVRQNGREEDLCTPDPKGRSLGFPFPGESGGYEMACTSGAVGKCIAFGYRQWTERPDGPPHKALHEACVHMIRADYGGDEQTYTRDGTNIYTCDRFGVRRCHENPPMEFEASWGSHGAVCVARPRIIEIVTLRQLTERYPQLEARTGPPACPENMPFSREAALLLNRS